MNPGNEDWSKEPLNQQGKKEPSGPGEFLDIMHWSATLIGAFLGVWTIAFKKGGYWWWLVALFFAIGIFVGGIQKKKLEELVHKSKTK